jgi:DNA-binding protein HU-beta
VNKSELIEAVAKTAGISKATAGDALDATLSAIKVALKKDQSVTLVGFGTFKVGKRAARTGRNPRTVKQLKLKQLKCQNLAQGRH